MGLTKRKDGFYLEFTVVDGGKVLPLAAGNLGAKLKRGNAGCSHRTVAKQLEALIKAKLLAGTMASEQVQQTTMTFAAWSKAYLAIEEVRKLRSYRERCQRIEAVLVPIFGRRLLQAITTKDVEDFRRERGNGRAVAAVNVGHNSLSRSSSSHAAESVHARRGILGCCL